MDLMTIRGVRGRINSEGTAELNLEDISRGLGFTQQKSGTEYVRWETVYGHLTDIGFSQHVGKDGFVPENVFYRLAMKAKNETAESFQATVADEILPSIRKHGAYMTPESLEKALLSPDYLIQLATKLKEEQTARIAAENKLDEQRPLVAFAETCMDSERNMLVREVAKLASKNGIMIGERRLYNKLREWGMVFQTSTEPSQRAMEMGLFEIIKGVKQTPKGARDWETTKVTPKGQTYIINRLLKEAA